MKHLFNVINVYMIMLYGTDCKYVTCSSCVLGEKSRLKWLGEASLKKLDLIWVFKDGLDLVMGLGGSCFKWEKENEQKQKEISSM